VAIAQEPGGCVATAILASENQLVGYAAFHRPSGIETWGDDRSGKLIELGAVEVAPGMRGLRLAERLLAAAFSDGRFDDTVVFATLYRWHYDLERTGLGELGYRRMLERLYASVGLHPMPTNDVEVGSDHANRLVARIGDEAPPDVISEFQRLRLRRW
jgi:acetoin utilization protein AcuA